MIRTNTSWYTYFIKLFALSCTGLILQHSFAQMPRDRSETFNSIYSLLAQLSDNNNPEDYQLTRTISDTSALVSNIQNQLQERHDVPSEALIAAVDAYRQELHDALVSKDRDATYYHLNNVRNDAQLKWDLISRPSGFAPFDRQLLITVTIKTYRGNTLQPGYSVTCNPFRDALRKEALFPFSSDTNDAVAYLPPGHYRLQLYKGPNLIVSKDIRIGLSRKLTEEVDINVSPYEK